MTMTLNKDLLAAFEAGAKAGSEGANRHDNPHLYTSDMSDAWAMGYQLEVSRRMIDVRACKIVGFSRRGMTIVEPNGGRRFRWRVSYVPCTQGHEIWRAAA